MRSYDDDDDNDDDDDDDNNNNNNNNNARSILKQTGEFLDQLCKYTLSKIEFQSVKLLLISLHICFII